MKNLFARPFQIALLLGAATAFAAPGHLIAENHIVSPATMQKDVVTASAARQQNQQKVIGLLNSPEGQQALKSAHIDPQQVTTAVSQLSDSEMASLAVRADKAQKAFAAGNIDNHDLLIILVAIAVLILIIVAVH
jgi:uncharacterized protein YbaP (TraB family)